MLFNNNYITKILLSLGFKEVDFNFKLHPTLNLNDFMGTYAVSKKIKFVSGKMGSNNSQL